MQRIKELCKERGETQKAVAQILNIQPNTFSQYVNGKRTPDLKTLEAIAKYFQVSVFYLLGQTDDPKQPDSELLIGSRLKKLISDNKIDINKLAQHLDIPVSSLRYFCNNDESEIMVSTLEAIANVFQVNPEYLTGITDDPNDYENDADLEASTYNIRKELGIDLERAASFQIARDADIAREASSRSSAVSSYTKSNYINRDNHIKAARKNKKYTQDKLAKLLNVSRATVAMWETQNSQPDNDMLIKIADVLGVSTDYLLGRTDKTSDKDVRYAASLKDGYSELSEDDKNLVNSLIDSLTNKK